MAILDIQELSFCYPASERTILDQINLTVQPGEFVLLCGTSGCGKTTLLRHIKRELSPVGTSSGEVLFEGKPLSAYDDSFMARHIGMVQQSPENQTVTDRVLSELVFTMENVGFESELMRRRVAELSHYFGLDAWLSKPVFELSGGQKQLVQLASVLALQPRLLLLDEPTAQLDPLAARELIQLLHRINQDLGLTIIIAEHRFDELLPIVDRVVFMEDGSVKHSGTPREVTEALWSNEVGHSRDFVPPIPRLFLQAGVSREVPLTVKEGRKHAWLAALRYQATQSAQSARTTQTTQTTQTSQTAQSPQTTERSSMSLLNRFRLGDSTSKPSSNDRQPILLECREVYLQYTPQDIAPVLKNASLSVAAGECLAILGANGSGKTTLLKVLAGIMKPQKGKVLLEGNHLGKMKAHERAARVGFLHQNPLTYFLEETVEQELSLAMARAGSQGSLTLEQTAETFGLLHLLKQHPYDLSEGERQLAALAGILLAGASLLLLDEPTKGLDPAAKRQWGERLRELKRIGKTIVMVTHDIEFAAEYATRCTMMFDGTLTAAQDPKLFFSDNLYYTTAMNQLMRWN
ncbi:ABC transporter ATP-binding protein [Paenibacillus hexagrammi]|uniref:Energy-coupling factor ABC transporter ATP-binding protein n=1 Tax=Paenibacillus hexagrammi TaxID=2908839 RepID=A0ABY3SFL9_9BACL|nr:ABC transporter ATP-binding protein [Paenibacillus sp. YPD9-1]UJF32612.1 energy-coupling factor ABC transporter ATP-binding protein [Paenibacillus sp. YPD9-1]